MTKEEAIETITTVLENTATDVDYAYDKPDGTVKLGGMDISNALIMAVTALMEQIKAGQNEPLTLDELRKMDGEPVWVCGPEGKCSVWMLAYRDCCENRTEVADYEDYGEWLAYRHKPEGGAK